MKLIRGVAALMVPLVGSLMPGAAAEAQPKQVRAAMVYTASLGADKGWTTCAGVLLDHTRRQVIVPLQCAPRGSVACKSAARVTPGVQLAPRDFAAWVRARERCRVVKRLPRIHMAVIQMDRPLPRGARALARRTKPPAAGETLRLAAFAKQIPGLVGKVDVMGSVTRCRIDGVTPAFSARLLALSGPIAPGSAGGLVLDGDTLVGIMLGHANDIDGGFAVGASQLPSP